MTQKKRQSKELELLRAFKKESGWTYVRIGNAMGVNPMSVYHWLRGTRAPSPMARRVIRAFVVAHDPAKNGI
jgi:transcriptional regulator with XRE-family HTH domain